MQLSTIALLLVAVVVSSQARRFSQDKPLKSRAYGYGRPYRGIDSVIKGN